MTSEIDSEFWDKIGKILLMCFHCFTIIAMIVFKGYPASDLIKLVSSCLLFYLAQNDYSIFFSLDKLFLIILTIFYLYFPLHWGLYTIAIPFLLIGYELFMEIIDNHRDFIEKLMTKEEIVFYDSCRLFRSEYVVSFQKMYFFKRPKGLAGRTLRISQLMRDNFVPISTLVKFDTVTIEKQRYFFIFYLDIINICFSKISKPYFLMDIEEARENHKQYKKYDSRIEEYLISNTKNIINNKVRG